jgi:heptosyltransferase-2
MRYLIVRLSALGDVAVGSALLSRIRAEQPDAHVTWLVGQRAADIVRLFPGLDDVLTVDESALLRGNAFARLRAIAGVWRKLLSRRFDLVLLLHADARYRVLTLPLWRTTTYMLRLGPGPGSNPLPGRDRAAECARLLDGPRAAGPLGRHYPLADISSAFPRESRGVDVRPRVVLVPGGARNVMREDALRRWPVGSYRALAERLIADGYEVVLVGDKGDAGFGAEFDGIQVRNEIGAHSLVESVRLLADADVVVSHDTGPLHLARLVRTPSVALFGPTNPAEFVGADPGVMVLWGGEHLACRPCYDGRSFATCNDNLCLRSITVDSAFLAVQQMLARRRPGRSAPVMAAVSAPLAIP